MSEQKGGLIYHFGYPDSTSEQSDKIWKDDSAFQDVESKGEEKAIVVILFGWSGASDKHLEKYSDIYLKRGCIIVRCIAPPKAIFFDFDQLPILAKEVLNQIKEKELQSHPIFFHVLSNGGAYLYSHVLKELACESNPAVFNTRGTIIDSAPFSPTPLTCYRAIKAIGRSRSLFGLQYILEWFVVIAAVVRVFWSFYKLAWKISTVGTFERPKTIDKKKEDYPLQDFLSRIWKMNNHAKKSGVHLFLAGTFFDSGQY